MKQAFPSAEENAKQFERQNFNLNLEKRFSF